MLAERGTRALLASLLSCFALACVEVPHDRDVRIVSQVDVRPVNPNACTRRWTDLGS
jgi:hypothetical protein